MTSFAPKTPTDLIDFLSNSTIISFLTPNTPKEEIEKRCMYLLLSTLCNNNKLEFPITIEHKDKPDFRCYQPNGQIGVEITKATTEQYERARVLRDKHYPDVWLDLSHFKWGAPEKSSKEILQILETSRTRYTGPALYGKHIEKEWASGMSSCLFEKTEKLNRKDFQKFNQNWLLIIDNLSSALFDYDVALKRLFEDLQGYWNEHKQAGKTRFDILIIESKDELLLFSLSGFSKMEIFNLW